MNGITYYRLKSDYDGDVTNNCGLTGQQIDNNFYVLEGRDVKSLEVDGDDITIVLYNGDRITAEDALSGYAKDLSFDFDEENGTLTITQNGETTVIDGFGCDCGKVYTDNTLVGDGTKENPLGVSSMSQTGHYKPVIGIIDLTVDGTEMPENPHRGDRYIVKDEISNYGMLYDYHAVAQLACRLKGTGWHIPSKEEWDNMLNAIDEVKNHDSQEESVYLGKYAGKMLKGTEDGDCGWAECEQGGGDCPCGGAGTNGNCDDPLNPCMPMDCHHECVEPSNVTPETTEGIDCYFFDVLPTGYALDKNNVLYFGQKAYFWTSDVSENRSEAWAKGFDACHSDVFQNTMSTSNYMSIRLVKDYDGTNYYGAETIDGQIFETVIMPGGQIWTKNNVALNICPCNPDCKCHQINPNMGEDCDEKSIIYTIVEWDGTKWVSIVLENGYMVTIIDENGTPIDYHITINEYGDFELVSIIDGIADGVVEEVMERIGDLGGRVDAVEEKNREQDERLDTLESGLAQEIQDRINADQILQDQIDAISGGQEGLKKLINDGEFDTATSELVLIHKDTDEQTGEETRDEIVRVQIPFNFGEV